MRKEEEGHSRFRALPMQKLRSWQVHGVFGEVQEVHCGPNTFCLEKRLEREPDCVEP